MICAPFYSLLEFLGVTCWIIKWLIRWKPVQYGETPQVTKMGGAYKRSELPLCFSFMIYLHDFTLAKNHFLIFITGVPRVTQGLIQEKRLYFKDTDYSPTSSTKEKQTMLMSGFQNTNRPLAIFWRENFGGKTVFLGKMSNSQVIRNFYGRFARIVSEKFSNFQFWDVDKRPGFCCGISRFSI